MVSVGVSKLSLIFLDNGVKVNGHDMLLSQQLLPVIIRSLDEFFIFQQGSAPAHGAHAR